MKFTDGFWRVKDGIRLYHPAHVYDYEISKDSTTIIAPAQFITNRGQTLQGPVFTIRFSSPFEDVIRVQIWHYKGQKDKKTYFEFYKEEGYCPLIEVFSESIVITSGKLKAVINKKGEWKVEYYYEDKYLTRNGYKYLGYAIMPDNTTYMREQLSLSVGECVYGLGERFTPFVKNGQVIDMWNEDGGTNSDLAYKNIPFYITNRGYGVFVNDPGRVSFEVATENVERVQFSVEGEYLEYFIIGGSNMKNVLENYTKLTGRPQLPPAWSFGLWLTTSFTTSYDEKTVTNFIDGMIEKDIPLHVFHFDCFWMKDMHWVDFEWDRRVFPEPSQMLKRLKEKGVKICVWINPYVSQFSKLFDEGKEKGYFLKKPNGDVWQTDDWQPGMAIVDFTNPEACRWYSEKLKELIKMGVDCFKTDFGERIPTDVVYFDGSDPQKMHNYYTYLYNKTVYETLQETFGKGNAVVFARSATAGSQKFPVHWGGDCLASYESMAETLRGGLSLSLCGFGFWSHDIGGFESTATPDLYKRWVAFGLLSSHSRLHGNSAYKVPWLYDEEAVDVLRFFTKLKCKLMPYIFSAAVEATERGIPVLRPMVLEFPDDPACVYLDRQYMLGDSLLVAPIFSEDGYVEYYVPEGIWTNILTGEKVEGGKWRKEKHGYFSLPLLARPNTVIPIGSCDTRPDYDYADNVAMNIYHIDSGETLKSQIRNVEGKAEIEIEVRRHGDVIYVTNIRDSKKTWSLYFDSLRIEVISGASVKVDSNGSKINVYSDTAVLKVI
ncbi:glycoside hydrolase family 31 [Caldicellulosiruptor kronotskyensis 2002]|uniref:alpha-D-xyloside xylohydrolase n=1 Tax=Caldicellulosiruptor kronotskyensis (strain DSM 18902 / VKM B-2412 / 2002) TaxID=632348 RepID=E4SEK7_CALK2|nr:alpha-xylosidase [Caldicellulosiruptor kronotskyensis]ADQ45494.1 glycoside hydrolase family 31 [Caldicellulosiruptor kronotskyensis 2002]